MTYPRKRLPPWCIVQRTYGMAPLLWSLWGMATLFACSTDESSPGSDGGNNGGSAAHSGSAGSEGMSGSQAGGKSAGGSGGSVTHPRCWSEHGAVMVEIPAPDGSTYCMDTTEATRGHYAEFLKANLEGHTIIDDVCPDATDFRPRWQLKYNGDPSDPDTTKGTCYMEDYHGDNVLAPSQPDLPMACISWCQARAYCEWAGKRLCGRVGGGTVALDDELAEYKSAGLDEWFNACSNGGTTVYPYGNEFQPKTCADSVGVELSELENAVTPVDDNTACTGVKSGFNQLRNLSGNVSEWQDACAKVQNGNVMTMQCLFRGGSTSSQPAAEDLTCAFIAANTPQAQTQDRGIRCCAD